MPPFPGAKWRPVAYSGLHARQPYRAALLHTNGGGAQLFGWWTKLATGNDPRTRHVGAHYQVFADGTAECYVDPGLVVYHAYGASEWALGIETEDDGDNSRPWTPAQIQTIAAILHFHQVPAVLLTRPDAAHGVGYHQQQPAWNQDGHDCVGGIRRAQIPAVLAALAALDNPTPLEDPEMTPQQAAQLQRIEDKLDALTAPRRQDHSDPDPQHLSLGDVINEDDRLHGA